MIKIIWRSGELVISDTDCPPNVESLVETRLHYQHKHLVPNEERPWIKELKFEKVSLCRVLPGQACRTFVSYQGLLDRVVQTCKTKKLQYEIIDQREPFPSPIMKNMHGFWHTQHGTLIQFLAKNRSGILKAPTRYGKSSLIINTLRAFPTLPTVLAAPGVDLLGQLVTELRAALPGRDIRGLFTGSKNKTQSEDITVCSLDSLDKVNPENVRLLLIDEPHAVATPARQLRISKFKRARIFGFGATVNGRFDGSDIIVEALIGPVLFEKTFKQAVSEGAICSIKVYMFKLPFEPFHCSQRDQAYRFMLWKNPHFNQLMQDLTNLIPADWQTLIFADQAKQIELIEKMVEGGVPAIAGKMTKKERDEKFRAMKAGEIKRCIATLIYSQGVSFPDLRVVVNAAGGGGSITGTQKPGRLAQNRPGKTRGYLIDVLFIPEGIDVEELPKSAGTSWTWPVRDSHARMKVYEETGYDVEIIDSIEQIKFE